MLLTDVERLMLRLAVLFSPVEDFALQGTVLKFFGAAPSAVLVLVVLGMHLCRWLLAWNDPGVQASKFNRLLAGFAMVSFSSLFMVAFGGGLEILLKGAKYSLVIVSFLYFIYRLSTDFDYYRRAIYLATVVSVGGFILGDLLSALPGFLHFNENTNMRNRGLSLESSTFGTQIGVFALVCANLLRSRHVAAGVFLIMLGVLTASGSKGAILSMLLALIIVYLIKSRNVVLAISLILMVTAGVFYLVPLELVGAQFDFESGTSLATRLTMMLLSLKIASTTVIGVGPGGTVFSVIVFGPALLNFVKSYFSIPLLFDEVDAYMRGDPDAAITFKSFFAENAVIFGVPFILFFTFWLTPRLIQVVKISSYSMAVLGVFLWLALTFYHSGYGYYSIGVGLACVLAASNEKNSLGHA